MCRQALLCKWGSAFIISVVEHKEEQKEGLRETSEQLFHLRVETN
jgi:hypothetical protein